MTQVFSCEFSKILRTPFLKNTSRRLLLLLAFQKQPPEGFYWKNVFLKILQNSQENSFAKFSKALFLQNISGRLLLAFPCNFIKWGTANNVWKISDEDSLSRNTNLRSTVQVHHFFFRRDKLSVYVFIGLHCLLPETAIRVETFCKKRRS